MRKRNTQNLRIARKNYTQFWRVSIVEHDAIIHSDDIISQRSSKQYNPVPILRERLLRRLPQAPMNTEFFCGCVIHTDIQLKCFIRQNGTFSYEDHNETGIYDFLFRKS